MASSSFTTNLGLCNWSDSDRPKRADFISDNGIIDNVLGGHVLNTALHMNAAEKSKALEPFACFIYAGTGESSRTITTSFRPSFALVFKKNEPLAMYSDGVNIVNSGITTDGDGNTSGVAITTNGVIVQQQSAASNGKRFSLNEEGCQYAIIAFK